MKINFAKYLLEILLEQGKVDVPGLGKFELEKKASEFGEGRKTLKAPTQEIVFSETHNSADTKLRDRISNKEGGDIDNLKADEFVNQFTSDVSKGLVDEGEVEIAYLGTIKRSGAGQINFVQNQATIDKLNKYLPEVSLPETQKTPEKEVTASAKVADPKPAATSIRKDIKTEPTPSYVEPEKSGLGWLKWVIGILGFIILSTMLFKMCGKEDQSAYKSNQAKEETKLDEQGTVETEAKEDITETLNSEDEKETEMQEEGNKVESSSPNPNAASDFNKEKCIVIIGSYQSSKNVKSASAKIESKGYALYKETHGAYTRVGLNMNCDDISGSYKSFVRDISREFGVNAWFLSPEVKQ